MSDKTEKKIKILSSAVFIAQAVIYVIFAFKFMREDLTVSLIFVALAFISILLQIPFHKLASDISAKQEPKRTQSLADIYSPDYIRTTTTEYLKKEKKEEKKAKRSSPQAEDLTREISLTPEIAKAADGLIQTKETPAFFSTTTIDRMAINNKTRSVTKFARDFGATLCAGGLHTAAVTQRGNVNAVGYNAYGQCDTQRWQNVISIAAGAYHTAALMRDGTCVATGYNGAGQCNVGTWAGICRIAAGQAHTVGLRVDGTCIATGDNTYNQCNIGDWRDIISIVAGYNYTIGLRADGTIVAVGSNTEGDWSGSKWGKQKILLHIDNLQMEHDDGKPG